MDQDQTGISGFSESDLRNAYSDNGDVALPDEMPAQPQSQGPAQAEPTQGGPTRQPAKQSGPDDVVLPDERSNLENIYQQVQTTDPERAAKILSIQRKLDQPAAYIDKNLDSLQNAVNAPSGGFFKELEDQYPQTAKFISDPKNMAVAHDDLPNLAQHEDLVQKVTEANSLYDTFKYGLESSSGGLSVRRGLPNLSMPSNPTMSQSVASMIGGAIGDLPAMAIGGAAGSMAGLFAGGAAGVPGGLPGILGGATIGTGAGAMAGGFAFPAALKTALTQEYQSGKITSFGDILKEAAKQSAVGLATYATGGLAGKLGLGTLGKLAAENVGMTATGSAVEGKAPTTQDFVNNMITLGVFHGGEHAISGLSSLISAEKATNSKAFYTDLGETADASKLRTRLPESYQEMMASVSGDTPVENVYIPAEAAQSYFQSKNIDPDAVMAELGATKSFEEAKQTGGDVQIPLSTWVSKMSGTEHYQGLADDIKFDPEDLTPRQVQDRQAEIKSQVQDLINQQQKDQAAQAQRDQVNQHLDQASNVYKKIQEQMKAAGMTGAETQFSPQLHEAFFKALGERMGIDPAELADRFPVSVGKFETPEEANASPVPQAKTDTSFDFGENAPAEESGHAPAEAAQAGYKPEVLQQIRSDIEAGNVEKGNVTKDNEGYVTGRHGAVSTYPEYFQKKGFTKKETLRAIDKHLEGKELTEKQAKIVDDLYHSSGYDKEAKKAVPSEPFLQSAKYDQGAPKLEAAPRGRIRIGQEGYAIDLFKNADKSTFLHETGHYFLDVMGHIASDDTAPQDVKDDYNTVLKWLGVGSRDEIGTEQHEKFARGFEQYLMEGKAPSSALARAFDRFRNWLTQVYKSAKNLNVDMSNDVRGVMDRMLASKEAIEQAQRESGYTGESIKGLPPELEGKIRDLQSKARDQAERSLLKEQMSEISEKNKQKLALERVRLEGAVRDQVGEKPLYKAMDEAVEKIGKDKMAGTIAEKFLAEKLKPKESGQFEALAEVHGFSSGEELAKQMIMAEEGNTRQHEIDSTVQAGMESLSGITNPDEIRGQAMREIHTEKMTELLALEREALASLIHKEDVKQEARKRNQAEAEAQRAQEEAEAAKEKDETKRAAITEKIRQRFEARFKAAHDDDINAEVAKRAKVQAKADVQAAKESARQILGDKPIKEATNSKKYITAERNAAVKAAKALARGDYEKASEFKRQQMLNHAIAAEAMRNETQADKSVSYLKDFAKRRADLKDMPYGFIRQVDKLLAGSGFSEDRIEDMQTLSEIAKKMAADGEDAAEIANRTGLKQDPTGAWVSETLPEMVSRVNETTSRALIMPDSVMSGTRREYSDLTMQQLRDLQDAVKSIAYLGKTSDRFLGDFKTMEIKTAAAGFRASVEEKIGTPMADQMKPGSAHESRMGELFQSLAKVPGFFTRVLDTMLTTCHKLDGLEEGPAKENIYRPFEEAESRKLKRTGDAIKELDDIYAKHFDQKEFSKYGDTRINVDGRFFTKREILAMALNWGNDGNRQRLMDGFGFDQSKMERIFQNLGKNDWDFCQSVWDHLDKYWPEIDKLEMDVNGVEPKGVEAAPFENAHGKYEGGYYPVAYDGSRSVEAYKNDLSRDATYKKYSTAAAHTEQGHAQARASQVNRAISLDLNVLQNHHENVIHDLEFRRAVIDVSRFLNQKDAKAAIVNAIGIKGYQGINDWVKSAAGSSSEPIGPIDNAARWFRFKSTFFNMGWRLVSAPKIAAENVINTASEVGAAGAFRALKDYYFNPGTHDMVVGKSEFMRARAEHLDRDLGDVQKKWAGTKESAMRQFAFIIHAKLDQGVSFPLWAHTYNEGIAEHGEERLAVNQADEAVKRTFMSGGGVDQAAIMRGGEMTKAMTVAYGYQSMMWNRFSTQMFEAGQEANQGNYGKTAAVLAHSFIYTFALPAVIAAITREVLRNSTGGSSSQDRKKRITASLLEEASPLKFIPVLRDASPYLIKKSLGEQASYNSTPIEQAAEILLGTIGEGIHAVSSGHPNGKLAEHVSNAISFTTGIPKQMNDQVFNFLDFQHNHGQATWRDAISRRVKK